MAETTEGCRLKKELRGEKVPAWGRGADFGTQMEGGEQSGSQGDVGTCREAQGGGALCLSSSAGVSADGWAGGGQNDISEKKTCCGF